MLTVLARAKINLYLHVLGHDGETGFHVLETMVAFTDWGDVLSFDAADELSFAISGPFAGFFTDDELTAERESRNLVMRAFYGVADAAGIARPAGRIHLVKNIPPGAGLGGGSADAAAAIALAQKAFGVTLDAHTINTLATNLGADVPMCVRGCAALYQGRGDRHVRDIRLPDDAAALIVYPGTPTATAAVFHEYRAGKVAYRLPAAGVPPKFTSVAKMESFLAKTDNDLAGAAITVNADTRTAMAALVGVSGGASVRVTGSGSAVFVLGRYGPLSESLALIQNDYPGMAARAVRLS